MYLELFFLIICTSWYIDITLITLIFFLNLIFISYRVSTQKRDHEEHMTISHETSYGIWGVVPMKIESIRNAGNRTSRHNPWYLFSHSFSLILFFKSLAVP